MGVFPANNIQQKIQSIKSLSNVLKMLKNEKLKWIQLKHLCKIIWNLKVIAWGRFYENVHFLAEL